MPGSGASLADVAAAFAAVGAAPAAAVVAAGAGGLEQPASTVIDTASIRNPNIGDFKEGIWTPF